MASVGKVTFVCAVLVALNGINFSTCRCLHESGIVLRLTNNGLQYADEVGISRLKEQLQHEKIGDNSGRAGTPIGNVDYTLSNMRVTEVSIPQSSFRTAPGIGVTLQASQIGISLTGDWHYSTRGWIPIRDGGSFDIRGRDLEFSVTVKLNEQDGRPTISAQQCTAAANGLDVKFHGGASWLYNLFSGNIERSLQDSFQKVVCDAVRKSIDEDAAAQLKTFKVRSAVEKYAIIDYSLTRNPDFSPNFMDVYLKGEFQSTFHHHEVLFCPNLPLPVPPVSKRMVYIWLSDYVLNSASRVYHNEGHISTVVSSYEKGSKRHRLTTKELQYLVGKLQTLYPDRPGQVRLYTTQPPVFETNESGTNATMIGNAEIWVKLENGSMFHAFTLNVLMCLTVTLQTKEPERLVANANNARVKLSVNESFIGDIKTNIRFFNEFFIPMATEPLLKEINKYGARGFKLPMIEDSEYVDSKVTTGKHYTLIETDVKYKPRLTQLLRHTGRRSEDGPKDDYLYFEADDKVF